MISNPYLYTHKLAHTLVTHSLNIDGNFDEDEAWGKGEARNNKLVFIGKNLDHDELREGFAATLNTPANQEKIRAINEAETLKRKAGAFLSAAQRDDCAALQRLLSDGASPSSSNHVGQSALHIAALWGNYKGESAKRGKTRRGEARRSEAKRSEASENFVAHSKKNLSLPNS